MKSVNIHEAKTHLSRLVEAAAKGEAFIIAKAGKPMVKVVPLEVAEAQEKPKRYGFLDGVFPVPDDFDTMMQDEIIAMFEGKHEGELNPDFAHLEPKRLKPGEFGWKGGT